MTFSSLQSEVIKKGLVSKQAFSLGFKLIGAQLKAEQYIPTHKMDMPIDEHDDSPLKNMQHAKRLWIALQDYAATHGYEISTLEDVARAYVIGSSKPIVKADAEMLARRARIAGTNEREINESAARSIMKTQAILEEKVNKIVAELSDIHSYANAWLNVTEEIDENVLFTKEWLEENYPKIVKAQIRFWQTYNNWDDAELILIEADQALLA